MIIDALQIRFGGVDTNGEGVYGKAVYADGTLSVSFESRCDQNAVVPLLGRIEEAISTVFSQDQAPRVGALVPGLVKEGSHGESSVPEFMIGTIDRVEKSITACSKELHDVSKAIVAVQDRLSAVEVQRDDISAKFASLAEETVVRITAAYDSVDKALADVQSRLGMLETQKNADAVRTNTLVDKLEKWAANEDAREQADKEEHKAMLAIVALLRNAITTIDERSKRLEDVVFPKDAALETDKKAVAVDKASPSSSRDADRAQESEVSPGRAMDEEAAQPRQSTGRVKQAVGAQQPAKSFAAAFAEGVVAAAKLGVQPNAPAPDTAKAFGIDVDAAPSFVGDMGEEEPLDEAEDVLPGTEKALTVADMLHDTMAKERCIAVLKQLAKDASVYFGEIKNGSALPVTTLIFALAKYDLTGATPLDKWVAKRISEQDELRTYAKAIVDCLSEEGDEKRVARNCKILAEHFVGPIAVAMSGRILPIAQLESALATARGTRANIKAAGAA